MPVKTAVCVIVKDERHDIAEWVCHHFLMGFDTVIVFDHGSTDGTANVLRSMITANELDIRIHPWGMPVTKGNSIHQTTAYERACQLYGWEFNWMMFCDADEFLDIPGTNLGAFLARFENCDQVCLPWAIFGSSGHDRAPPGLVTENYTRRAEASFSPCQHVKSFVRPLFVHGWPNPHAAWTRGRTLMADGRPPAWDGAPGIQTDGSDFAFGKINHYITRSREHWERRLARGQSSPRDWNTFKAYDRNDVEDTALADRSGTLRVHLACAGVFVEDAE